MNDMDIRELRSEEYDELADLIEAWVPNKAGDLRSGKLFGGGKYSNLVAVLDGSIVGWLEGMHDSGLWNDFHGLPEDAAGPRCSYVDFVFVPRGLRRQGVGGSLVQAFEDDALSENNKFVCLAPQPGANERQVQSFYGKLGYSLAGRRAGQYHYLMGKHLR